MASLFSLEIAMDRMTVFFTAENERGFVQAVISVDDWPHFDALGAVKTCDQVVKTSRKSRAVDDHAKTIARNNHGG